MGNKNAENNIYPVGPVCKHKVIFRYYQYYPFPFRDIIIQAIAGR